MMRTEKELSRRVPQGPSGRSLRPFGPLVFLLLIGFLWLTGPAQAQTFKVGSFTKSTGAAPGSGVEVRE